MIIGCRYLGAIVFGLGMGRELGLNGLLIAFGAVLLLFSTLPSNNQTKGE